MDNWFSELSRVENPGILELQLFVDEVNRFLEYVLKDGGARVWQRYPELHQQAQFVYDTEIRQAVRDLRKAIPEIPESSLTHHGLLGAAARFKYNVIATVARRWRQMRGHFTVGKGFRRVVEAIDAHLDSLIQAAGGVGGIVKEFKDALLALAPE